MLVTKSIFDINKNSSNYGNIVTTVLYSKFPTNPIGYSVDIYYQVFGPNNILLRDYPSTADVTISNSGSYILPNVLLPLVTNGDVQNGEYLVNFKLVPNQGAVPSYINNKLFLVVKNQGIDFCTIKSNLDISSNCAYGEITAVDTTNYLDTTLISREIVLNYPVIPKVTTPASVISTLSSLNALIDYANVSYNFSHSAVYEHYYSGSGSRLNDDATAVFVVQESIEGVLDYKVICETDLCELLLCIEKFTKKISIEASEASGLRNLPSDKVDKFSMIYAYLNLYFAFKECGDHNKSSDYYNLIIEETGCSCGCASSNTSTPIKIVRIGSGSITSIVGDYPIVVGQSGNSVSIGLDPSYNTGTGTGTGTGITTVTASNTNNDGFLTATTVGSNVNVNFDSSLLGWTAWVTILSSQVNLNNFSVDQTPAPLRYSFNQLFGQIRIDGTFTLDPSANLMGLPICLFNSNVLPQFPAFFNTTRSNIPIPCFNIEGEVIGSLKTGSVNGQDTLIFSYNQKYSVKSIIYTNGIINYN